MRTLSLLVLTFFLAGCFPKEIIREVVVPARIPSLCTAACPASEGKPVTNGELAEAWAARGETIDCYKARQACVLEMTTQGDPK